MKIAQSRVGKEVSIPEWEPDRLNPCRLKRMLKTIRLKFGSNPVSAPLSFDPGNVTIFVGPNNSGKSLMLREIESYINAGSPSVHQIIESVTPKELEPEDAEKLIRDREIDPTSQYGPKRADQAFVHRPQPGSQGGGARWVQLAQISAYFQAAKGGTTPDARTVLQQFVSLFVVRLDGLSRFQLT